jgi:hypothetical protein
MLKVLIVVAGAAASLCLRLLNRVRSIAKSVLFGCTFDRFDVSYPHIYKRSFGVLSQVVFYQTELLR